MGFYRHRMPDREIQMAKDWTQEKLIDTLEKECEQLRGWYIAKIDQNAELQTQIESCSAEIERLREALKASVATIDALYEHLERVEKAGGATSLEGVAACHIMLKSMRKNANRVEELVMKPAIAALKGDE
jgi:septal ring factor EnvC (AmiA/AmiB activator)